MDSGTDHNYPVNKLGGGLWDQSHIQLSMPRTSPCCDAILLEHNSEYYCTSCGDNISLITN